MKIQDIRGYVPMVGDPVAVGVKHGSCGAQLSIREVVDVRPDGVVMRSYDEDGKPGKAFVYRATYGFLVLPRKFRDALGKS